MKGAAREGRPVTVIVGKFFEPVYEDGKLIGPAEVARRDFPMIEKKEERPSCASPG
jgi:hypothetical protein